MQRSAIGTEFGKFIVKKESQKMWSKGRGGLKVGRD